MGHWYLLQTKPYGEPTAQLNLERQHYEVYFPRVQQAVRVAGRLALRIGALFPRYLFVRLSEGQQSFAPLSSTVGAIGLVRFGGRFASVADEVIHELRARADPQTGLHQLGRSRFTSGSAVRIASGPFAGLEAVFERQVGRERVLVLLSVLGEQTRALLPAELVIPVSAW